MISQENPQILVKIWKKMAEKQVIHIWETGDLEKFLDASFILYFLWSLSFLQSTEFELFKLWAQGATKQSKNKMAFL